MLFVLRPDYVPPPGSSIGVRNVVQALKTFGAYVVDQGADYVLAVKGNQETLHDAVIAYIEDGA